jgi:hypothetical protein
VQRAGDAAERWRLFTQLQAGLLQALGHAPGKLPTCTNSLPARRFRSGTCNCHSSPSSPPTSLAPKTRTCSTTSCSACTTAASRCPKPCAMRPGPTCSRAWCSVPTPHRATCCCAGWTNGCCSTATSGPTTARCASTGPTSSTARTPTPSKPAPRCCTRTASPAKATACWRAWTKTPTSTPSASAKT